MADVPDLRGAIECLAAIDRASCSQGEHRAADWIADELSDRGARARVERERLHGTYWWPLGIAAAAGVAGALSARRGRRGTGAALATLGAAAAADDLGAGRRWLRRVLPKQVAANVVGEAGDPAAEHTLVVVSHHDAAHSGLFFDPRITEFVGRRFQPAPGRPPKMPPVMAPLVAGPAVVALAAAAGARRIASLGAAVCAGIIASFADIALRPTVPGANDNLSGVATVLGLASALRDRPVGGLRVLLVSTGAEESMMEGMRAFARRHFGELPPDRTHLLCVDTVGSPHLVLAEAEGVLRIRSYDPPLKDLVADCADQAGITLRRGLRMRLGTDGYIALRHGIPAAMLTSVDHHGVASNYHWPTDTPDRVDYGNVAGAVELCERVARRLAGSSSRSGSGLQP